MSETLARANNVMERVQINNSIERGAVELRAKFYGNVTRQLNNRSMNRMNVRRKNISIYSVNS